MYFTVNSVMYTYTYIHTFLNIIQPLVNCRVLFEFDLIYTIYIV